MTTRSKRGNEDICENSATEAILELSSKLLLMVSSIESMDEGFMYTIRRENQMTLEVMQTLIEETKRAANVTKALLEKKQHSNKHNCATMHKLTEDRILGSKSSHLKTQNNKDGIKNAKKNMEET